MENKKDVTDSEAARAHLHGARAAENAGRFPPIPAWLVLVNAVLIAAFVLTPLVEGRTTELMGLVAMLLLLIDVVAINRLGVFGSGATTTGTIVVLVLLTVIVGGSFALYAAMGHEWLVVVAACLAAVTVLAAGLSYRRAAGRWK